MPPPASHRPAQVCANYPVCSALAARPRSGGARTLQVCCTNCLTRPACVHPDCTNKSAPTNSSTPLCSLHLSDPCHDRTREWPRCRNVWLGCRMLAEKKEVSASPAKDMPGPVSTPTCGPGPRGGPGGLPGGPGAPAAPPEPSPGSPEALLRHPKALLGSPRTHPGLPGIPKDLPMGPPRPPRHLL